ncbi:hypothetical protein BBJ28_00001836 [Nothophytophthora sp. Chile5]|nr:hypothetical protein BBJ28_00001836 [Nothophytophthora sp. Chile5]
MPPPSLPLRSLLLRDFLSHHECAAVALVCRSWHTVASAVLHGTGSLLLTSETCALHRVPGRAERPERLHAVLRRCHALFPHLEVEQELPAASDEQLQRVHGAVYVAMVASMSSKVERSMAALETIRRGHLINGKSEKALASVAVAGTNGRVKHKPTVKSKEEYYAQFEYVDLGEDTTLMRHTLAAAREAAGGVCLAVDRVLVGERGLRNAFCAVRPPGHHAEPHQAMGFCVFNNVAVGALHALETHGLKRVAIVDVDVHHGNGTQAVATSDPRLLYVSLHQAAPCFPSTGHASESGPHDNLLNVPLRARCSSRTYREQFRAKVSPRLLKFQPQLILVSMGFDASARDPLADLRLEASDYYWITRELCELAWICCDGRLVSALEGGYHLGALADGAEKHMQALIHGGCRPDGLTTNMLYHTT